ncbi:Uncharacterised protein [Bordetella pertussis]|nr:Uncharacterised protein [Bordetella pertussis]
MRARRAVQRDGAARAGADLYPAAQLGVVVGRPPRRVDQVHDVAVDRRRHIQGGRRVPAGEQFLLREPRRAGRVGLGRGAQQGQHRDLVVGGRIIQPDLHQETVHLRFRQRIRALLLDGVLGGQHHEQRRHRPRHPAHRDLPLFHRLQQGRLHLGRRAVDLVGQHQVAEQRPLLEFDALAAVGVLLQHVGAGDVRRQQIGRELDAPHGRVQVRRQRLDRARLGQARQAFEQYVAVGQQGDQHMADHRRLPQHRRGHRLFQRHNAITIGHACSCVYPKRPAPATGARRLSGWRRGLGGPGPASIARASSPFESPGATWD